LTIAEKGKIVLSEKLLYELFRQSEGNKFKKLNLNEIFKLSCTGTFQFTNEDNNTQLLNQIITILQKEGYIEKEGDNLYITDKGKTHLNK
jgi:predicted methyltransferase